MNPTVSAGIQITRPITIYLQTASVILLFGPRLEAGVINTVIDGASLPAGLYLCRLEAKKSSAGRKMVLI